jgi:hypothetical protein
MGLTRHVLLWHGERNPMDQDSWIGLTFIVATEGQGSCFEQRRDPEWLR